VMTVVILKLIGLVTPLRASVREEGMGLDLSQHGEEAYASGEGAILVLPEVRGLTLSRVEGHGGETEHVETYRGTSVKMELSEKVRLEIGVSDHLVDPPVPPTLSSAHPGGWATERGAWCRWRRSTASAPARRTRPRSRPWPRPRPPEPEAGPDTD